MCDKIDFVKQIKIKVIPNAKKNQVMEDSGKFKVYVNAPAVDNKANKALVEVLADHFGIRKSRIKIIRGDRAREKTVEISD